MNYSIGEVANITGISISTLRFYDREGLFPNIERTGGGIRVFSDMEIEINDTALTAGSEDAVKNMKEGSVSV